MNPKKDTVAITFRCSKEVAEQLDQLCQVMGVKRSEFLISSISSEFDKLQGNPKLMEAYEQLRQIAETMKKLSGQDQAVNQTRPL